MIRRILFLTCFANSIAPFAKELAKRAKSSILLIMRPGGGPTKWGPGILFIMFFGQAKDVCNTMDEETARIANLYYPEVETRLYPDIEFKLKNTEDLSLALKNLFSSGLL